MIITRIRLQQIKQNSGLHKIGLHADGLCETCKVPQTGQHIITECINTKDLQNEIANNSPGGKLPTYEVILNNPVIMDYLADYLIQNEMNI